MSQIAATFCPRQLTAQGYDRSQSGIDDGAQSARIVADQRAEVHRQPSFDLRDGARHRTRPQGVQDLRAERDQHGCGLGLPWDAWLSGGQNDRRIAQHRLLRGGQAQRSCGPAPTRSQRRAAARNGPTGTRSAQELKQHDAHQYTSLAPGCEAGTPAAVQALGRQVKRACRTAKRAGEGCRALGSARCRSRLITRSPILQVGRAELQRPRDANENGFSGDVAVLISHGMHRRQRRTARAATPASRQAGNHGPCGGPATIHTAPSSGSSHRCLGHKRQHAQCPPRWELRFGQRSGRS